LDREYVLYVVSNIVGHLLAEINGGLMKVGSLTLFVAEVVEYGFDLLCFLDGSLAA